ncbi:hypothetical protein PNIG_a1521 [Pseudoalteromonas nigrifaciens]|uniref:Uncharacterized protein n=1 Tax=Pseudoalteromonas nigrifaciens TaxID=28109 RepID=A0AAC9UFT1_9GAMM|nr:hypothetical protein [Pseudoalteromonas nigrifaciens]ASM53670.1 hypothetical protein PNIG_a1521 [Pseudoalteromonas nigrifaciens]GEN40664.1 hypothetical protein PNI02_01300 [Pseudoalteromonas nigrifaciens]SUC52485.1 Uncharacterised protein [Pseudoalteromonas nigrifaciens]
MTQQPLPESKANILLEQIFNHLKFNREVDGFSKLRFLKEVDDISDLEPKLVIKGMLFHALGEFDEGESYFNRASNMFGPTPFVVINHIGALTSLGCYRLIKDYYVKYRQSTSTTVLVEALEDACKYSQLDVIILILNALEPMEVGLEEFKAQLEDAKYKRELLSNVYENYGLDQSTVDQHVDAALKVLEERKVKYKSCGMNLYDSEGIDIYFQIEASTQELLELNEELVDVVIEDDIMHSCVTTRFRPYS